MLLEQEKASAEGMGQMKLLDGLNEDMLKQMGEAFSGYSLDEAEYIRENALDLQRKLAWEEKNDD